MTSTEASRLVAMLVAAYPALRLDEERARAMMSGYRTMLVSLPVEAATAAIKRLIVTSKWCPSVAEIYAAALEVCEGPSRTAAEAWGDVTRAIGRYGSYRKPGRDFEFVDPIVAQIVEAFGWRELCLSEFPAADRARFLEAYAQLSANKRRERVAGALPGAAAAPALPSGTRAVIPPEPPKELAKGDDEEPVPAAELAEFWASFASNFGKGKR